MIAFFVSAHGFGHAARASAVMAAIRRIEPTYPVDVFTQIPAWFFEESVQGPVHYHALKTDVGMMQQDPFSADVPKTLEGLAHFLPLSENHVAGLAKQLQEKGCQAVVCDISPLGIAVAQKTGIPSILIENFTWDWIYEPYLGKYPAFESIISQLRDLFSSADVHLQTEPICAPKKDRLQLKPIGRSPKSPSDIVRSKLGVSPSTPLVLITMGGIATQHTFLDQLYNLSSVMFVVPHTVQTISKHRNVIVLPHHSEFYHPDLVYASDLVIGKLGYSTLAEVGHAGKPFAYILRKDSRESNILADYAINHLQGIALSENDFISCNWIRRIPELLKLKATVPVFKNDAAMAANLILTLKAGNNDRYNQSSEKNSSGPSF